MGWHSGLWRGSKVSSGMASDSWPMPGIRIHGMVSNASSPLPVRRRPHHRRRVEPTVLGLHRSRFLIPEAVLPAPLTGGNDDPGPGKQIRSYRCSPEKPLQSVEQSEHWQDIGKIAAGQMLVETCEGAMH